MTGKSESLLFRLIPAVADGAALLLYILLIPRMTGYFQNKSLVHAGLIGGIYILFCYSVLLIRKQPGPPGGKSDPGRGTLGFFGLMFGISVTFMMAESGGLFERLQDMTGVTDTRTSLLVLGGVLLWLILAFLYMLALILNVPPAMERPPGKSAAAEAVGLLGVNAMILITMGFWHSYFSGVEPYEGLAWGGKILIFLLAYVFFMLFFAPPRMLFLRRRPGGIAVVTFIFQTAYFVWDFLSRTAWR